MGLVPELGGKVKPRCSVRFGVGGFMPDEKCAVIGRSDSLYGKETSLKFATEVKRGSVYPDNEPWYRRSRVCQSLGSLYASGLPVLLCFPRAFKLLIETADRDQICVFPSGASSGLVSDDEFASTLGLLLLAKRVFPGNQEVRDAPITPVIKRINPNPSTVEQFGRLRRSDRLAQSSTTRVLFPHTLSQDDKFDETCRKMFFLNSEELDEAILPYSAPEQSWPISVSQENEVLSEEEAMMVERSEQKNVK
jgi:hypothetical protein